MKYQIPPDIECPYCKEWQEICHDDGQGYEQDMVNRQMCNGCGNYFKFSANVQYYYTVKRIEGELEDEPIKTL